ncbi:MAG: RAMP superfamily CRISPR-associated protein [Wenzhouxiangellaceae bacterium]
MKTETAEWLTIDIRTFWHAGTGKSSGSYLDALAERNRDGLPVLPGRHIKGLLRDAYRHAFALDRIERLPDSLAAALEKSGIGTLEELLFGSISDKEIRTRTRPGMLRVSSGQLPLSERAALNAEPTLKPFLYFELFSTAIDANGVASTDSLRGIEAAAPTRLIARLDLELTATEPSHLEAQQALLDDECRWEWLDPALAMMDAVGASRHRGMGEAVITRGAGQQQRREAAA